nr:MAG TPA: hypothetical protein [Caudoviricetes sp.]
MAKQNRNRGRLTMRETGRTRPQIAVNSRQRNRPMNLTACRRTCR